MARDILVGRTLGPYLIEERLGGGGMATVYRGLHRALGLRRAIKVMSPGLATHDSFVELFYREARLAANLRHPNIVEIFDVAQQDSLHYLVMQLLAGQSLREVVRLESPISLRRVVHLVAQLAEALDYAHRQGIVHRDVKSANAFVGPADCLTLVDFGIARAADATHLTVTHGIGTPEYMAPEIFDERLAPPDANDHSVGVGTDLYSLGVVAYELVTGTLPFTGRTPQSVAYAQVNRDPPVPGMLRPELTAPVQAVLLRQLAKTPGERYRPARAFAAALTESLRAAELLDPVWATRLLVELERADGVSEEPASPPEHQRARWPIVLPSSGAGATEQAPAYRPAPLRFGRDDAKTNVVRADPPSERAVGARRRWLLPALGLLLATALGTVVSLPATSPFGPTVDPTSVADSRAARGSAAVNPPTAIVPTAVPTEAPPTPTLAPTTVPTSVALEPAAPAPTPGPEVRADEVIAQARAMIEGANRLPPEPVLEQLDRLHRELDPLSAKRHVVEDLMIRVLLDDSEQRLDAAFVLKDLDEGRAAQKLLSDADRRFDLAAGMRPGDSALQDRARQGRERVALTALWVEFDVAYKASQHDAQIAALAQIVAKRPEYRTSEGLAREKLYAAWISKAQEVWGAGLVEQAREALGEALKVDPHHPRARELLAAWFPPPRPAPARAAPARAAPARPATVQSSSVQAAPLPASEPQAPAPQPQRQQRQFVEVYVQQEFPGSVDSNQSSNSN